MVRSIILHFRFAGEFCDADYDGCADKPCMTGTTCTDVHPGEHAQTGKAFVCSECPAGYVQNYGICVGKIFMFIIFAIS